MSDLRTYDQLNAYFDNQQFVLKTQQQIAKDFAKFNLYFLDSFEIVPFSKNEIERLIGQLLVDLMKQGETRLLQLLYTIDLAEKEFLHITTNPNFVQLLSEKILFREAYKVFLRTKFSSSNPTDYDSISE
ncbi:MAG: hypothetical protein RI922_2082 [Bacteroidota bacterium]